MNSLSKQERANAAAYEAAKPDHFGDLHQRMKFVVQELQNATGYNPGGTLNLDFDRQFPNLWTAIFDLRPK